jgi:hypothetical protein
MLRIRTALLAVVTFALIAGSALAAGLVFDASGFDPFEEDEGYVDLMLEGDVITVVFSETEGHLPAKLVGDALPLDEDFEEDRIASPRALALYGGLPLGITPTSLTMDVEGDARAISRAILDRLVELGMTTSECHEGGPICTYDVWHGEAHWLLAITPLAEHAVVYLQGMRR